MKFIIRSLFISGLVLLIFSSIGFTQNSKDQGKFIMVIHGGAGTILKSQMTPEKENAYKEVLTLALQTGYNKLKAGESSLNAIESAVRIMEDSPFFNAGKGAVFTNEGKNEMDAAIMDGKTLMAGSVAGVTTIKNPITAARAVMEKSEHVMMVGAGAEKFAKESGVEIVDPKYFWTKERWDALQEIKKQDSIKAKLDQSDKKSIKLSIENRDHKFGTVGAVALDLNGNLAAATSTGGMTNKKYGRVGDAPLIGIGTYANKNVGISCTGWGEFFIRSVVAYDVAALVEYKGLTLKDAAELVIMKKVPALGGDGGLIALDKNGYVCMPFNTTGMYRGTVTKDGRIEVFIYKD